MQRCLFETDELSAFPVDSDQICILHSPKQLYDTLLNRIQKANERIVLSTLYIGTGTLEAELVNAITEAARDRHVSVLILLDSSRGTRGSTLTQQYAGTKQTDALLPPDGGDGVTVVASYSCDLLAPLTSIEGVRVVLYHNPHLRGWLHSLLPSRMNEVLGVQHIKAYVVDNSVMLSGANLSHEYFTNRQDRTWLFNQVPQLANFYHGLIDTISQFCYRLKPDGSIKPVSSEFDPQKTNLSRFKKHFHDAMVAYLDKVRRVHPNPLSPVANTYLFPLIQFGSYGLRLEERVTTQLICSTMADTQTPYSLSLASGYFNLTRAYQNLLLGYHQSRANSRLELLCASPIANGFLNSRGLSSFIPMAYRESLIHLLNQIGATPGSCTPIIREYNRRGWTFHAKGLWIEENRAPQSNKTSFRPSLLTLVGSSNFGYRSLNRDLESQLIVWTRDGDLQKRMQQEQNMLFNAAHTQAVNLPKLVAQTQFRLPWYIRFLHPLLHTYM